ncbi:MAG: hypothetical protein GX349_07070 [Firmicutes bacterium]|nr:hypothetical protein [Bacillota bacterium]
MTCPVCGSREVGKVGAKNYYCHDCCVEFALHPKGMMVYEVNADGTLIALNGVG